MYWQKRFDREDPDEELRGKIYAIREEHPNFGYRRICAVLQNQGIYINRKKVHRLTKKYGLLHTQEPQVQFVQRKGGTDRTKPREQAVLHKHPAPEDRDGYHGIQIL